MPGPYDTDVHAELTRVAARPPRHRLPLIAALAVMLVGSLAAPAPAAAARGKPGGPGLQPQVEKLDSDGGEIHGKPWPQRSRPEAQVPAPVWPKAGAATVSLPTAGDSRAIGEAAVRAGELPVMVRRAGGRLSAVRVEVLDRAGAPDRWRDGVLMRLSSGQAGQVALSVDYRGFRFAYGGEWASRLRLWQLPSCTLAATAGAACHASPLRSRNDAAAGTVTATVPVAAAAGTVVALAADDKGDSGDFKATSLAPSATWSAGGSTGDFSWSYPMRVPPAIGALQPTLALTYSSSSVDGRSNMTNNQPSWVGEGFEYWPGYIERRYVSCGDDMEGSANNNRKTGDLCWRSDNAVLNLKGTATELVHEAGKGWHARAEDGAKIAKVSGASNGDENGEHWKLTDADGTQYFFGLNDIAGETSPTASTNTVRVYGNHPDEPCHDSSFAASACNQAWRWNLDYVVDVRGNTMSFWYDREANKYSANLTDSSTVSYIRDSTLTRIDYGTWDRGSDGRSNSPIAQVVFDAASRCIAACDRDVPAQWPDVPWDQECKAAAETCSGNYSPTFWTTRRLSKITTRIWDTTKAAPAWQAVDSWTLTHSFPSPGDESRHAGLWLDKIVHTGHVGGTVTVPPITFEPTAMPNRVLTKHNTTNNWHRIGNIISETGSKIQVTYSLPDCTATNKPDEPHTNTRLCYPVIGPDPFDPDGRDITEWWHKYVVRQVSESDVQLTNGHQTPVKNTYYTYVGAPAWHYADDDGLIKQKYKTWSQFRGYETVKTRVGDTPGKQSLTVTRYLRGMHGDREKLSGGTRTVTVDASIGNETVRDEDHFAGTIREQIIYNGTESKPVSKTVNVPWLSPATATRTIHGDTVTARFNKTRVVYKAEALGVDGSRGWRVARTVSGFSDRYGTVEWTSEEGDLAVPGDEKCVSYTYNRNDDKNILQTVKQTTTTALSCGKAPTSPEDVLSDERHYFDGATSLDTLPKYGAITRTERLKDWVAAGGTVWQTFSEARFDDFGRQIRSTDVKGNTTITVYTPIDGGPVTAVSSTNPLGWTTTKTLAPYWGSTVRTTDPNGHTSDAEYDPLGRVWKVWKQGWPKTGNEEKPSAEYTYVLSPTRSDYPYVASKTLHAVGGYLTSYDIYDGLLRVRQTQAPAVGGGRLVTDTIHDELGRVEASYSEHAEPGDPSGTLWWEPVWSLRSLTRTLYDNANRKTDEIFLAGDGVTNLVEKWRTTTRYEGDLTKVTPPAGGTPTTTLTDIQGHTIEIRQHTADAGVDGPHQSTRFTHNRKDQLVKVVDPGRNEWTYRFDVKGRQVETVDPDKGKTTSAYNDFDELERTTDARGKTLVYTYDQIGRKTAVYDGTVSDATKRAEWKYDRTFAGRVALGQVTEAVRYDNGQAYRRQIGSYNRRYQPTAIRIVVPDSETGLGGNYDFFYTYSGYDGSILNNVFPAAGGLFVESVDTLYDKTSGLPNRQYTNLPNTFSYIAAQEYTPYGEPTLTTRMTRGGRYVQDATRYDTATRRVTRTFVKPETTAGNISDRSYTYDPVGNITAITEAPQIGSADNQCFRYDRLRRLTSAWTPAAGVDCAKPPAVAALGGPAPYWYDWTFDAIGNRRTQVSHTAAGDTKHTYAVPDSGPGVVRPHAVTAVNTEVPGQQPVTRSYGYDNTGNTASRPGPTGNTQALTWDTESRLASVTDGTATTTNLYDADGTRLIRRDATGVTIYLPGMELRREGGVTTGTRYYTFAGKVYASRTPVGGLVWLYNDHQGTQQTSVHAPTHKVSVRRQTPYGEPRGAQPIWPNQKGFVGGDIDPTGLTHVGAREYDPGLGRFISVDPVMDLNDPQQWHSYAYANNSPITNSDPTGLVNLPYEGGGGGGGGTTGGSGGPGNGGSGGSGGPTRGGGSGPPPDCNWLCKTKNFGKGAWNGWGKMTAAPYLAIRDTYNTVTGNWQAAVDGDISWGDAVVNTYGLVISANSSIYFLGKDALDEGRATVNAVQNGDWEGVGNHGFQAAHNVGNLIFSVVGPGGALKTVPRGTPRGLPSGVPKGNPKVGPRPGCTNSFVAGTRVLMPNGITRAIEDLEVRNTVLATDPEAGVTEVKEISATIIGNGNKNLVRITVDVDGEAGSATASITATDAHPFWLPAKTKWVKATDLRRGQWLQTDAGTWVQISAIRRWTQPAQVYNLTVTDIHTYHVMAGDVSVLVHNCNLGIAGSEQGVAHNRASLNVHGSDGFSGVYDPASGNFHARLSGGPDALVDQYGGHAQINREVFGGSRNTVGFAVVNRGDGNLQVRWNSRSVNERNFGDRAAPMEHRAAIVDSIRRATGMEVSG